MTAVNSAGSSSIVTVPAILTLPPASGVPQIGTIGQTTIVLSIAAGQFSKSATSNSWAASGTPPPATNPQTSANHPYTFTDLVPNTSYTFVVQAINSTGAGGTSGSSASARTLPGAPTNPLTSGITRVAITVSWTAPTNGAASYTVSGTGVTTVSGVIGTSTTFSGLTAGNSYGPFTVQSFNATGGGGSVSTAAAVRTLPPAVTNFQATAGSSTTQTIPLTWTAANGATSYTITYTDGTAKSVTGLTGTSTNITGLSNPGTGYTFTITSINASGSGDLTASATGYTAPSPPSGLATGTITSTTIPLTWSAPGGTITGYTLSATGTPGTPYALTYASNPTSYTISGLTGGTSYGPFTLTATNAGGTSSASNQVAAVSTTPAAPTGINFSSTTQTAITISWTGSTGAQSYQIAGTGVTTQSVNTTSVTFSSLSPNTSYGGFTITPYTGTGATGTAGTAGSIGARVTLAGSPTGATATIVGTTQINLSWTAPAGGATSYTVTGGGTPNVIGTTATVTGLADGTSYTFTITSTNATGSGGNTTVTQTAGYVYTGTIATLNNQFELNNMGKTGRTGPTAITYGTVPGSGTSYTLFLSSGIQVITIPRTGTYSITMAGARGGNPAGANAGNGRIITRTGISLSAYTQLWCVVGQTGGDNGTAITALNLSAGGGGASWVYTGSVTSASILMVAGGGGGGRWGGPAGGDGQFSTVATAGATNAGRAGGAAGTGGGGGGGGIAAQGGIYNGGAGNNVNGGTGAPDQGQGGGGGGGGMGLGTTGATFNGGTVTDEPNCRPGGFGGGGGCGYVAEYGGRGGGGGYNGGGGGSGNNSQGGGGSSFTNGGTITDGGTNTGYGYIRITRTA